MSKKYIVRCKELLPDGTGSITFNNSKFSVKGVLPGEKCSIELVYGKKETGAKMCGIIEPSEDRIPVVCDAFGKCGGCALLHMTYEAETAMKLERVRKLYSGICPEIPVDIIAADDPLHYRNKVYASFGFVKKGRGSEIVAGMYEENTRSVVNCNDCLIQNEKANAIVKTITDVMKKTGTRSFDPDTGTGVLRHVYIRVSEKSGKCMVVLVTGISEFKTKNVFISRLTECHPEVETIIHNVNGKKTGMILGDRSTVLYGKGYIEDELCGCRFRISPESFFQVNPKQTEKLYETAIGMAGLSGNETVLDAYSGIGTISLVAAGSAAKVIGVELNARAVSDAVINAKLNNISNAEFVNADAGKYMTENADVTGRNTPDVLFMDPPRSGSDEAFLKAVVRSEPRRIVYISCNPETQVRDIGFLIQKGWKVERIRAVDMFPRTGHVETVCLLVLRNDVTHINIDVDVEELVKDKRGQATYDQIRDYVKEQTGLHVTNLNIAQIKRKCGIIERENYNLPKSEDARQPACTKEKEEVILKAFRHFGLIGYDTI